MNQSAIDELRALIFKNEGPNLHEVQRIQSLARSLPYKDVAVVAGEVTEFLNHVNTQNKHLEEKRRCTKERIKTAMAQVFNADNDNEYLSAAKELQSAMREERIIQEQLGPVTKCYVRGRYTILTEIMGTVPKTLTRDIKLNKAELKRLEAEKLKNEVATAQYEACLSEGRKLATLQQAYANGDFFPVAADSLTDHPLRSRTGHRIGSRG